MRERREVEEEYKEKQRVRQKQKEFLEVWQTDIAKLHARKRLEAEMKQLDKVGVGIDSKVRSL